MEYEDYGKVFPFNNLLGKKNTYTVAALLSAALC